MSNQVMTSVVGRIFIFGGECTFEHGCKAGNNEKVMEIFLLNKREKVFESYQTNKRPRYRTYGHSLVPVSVDEICPPSN